ncbi:MAG: hypothetical protein HYW15_01995 [Candidatus Giovannonibacteria bacterium]|nr:MAG: hypothetical protein HYW15_01995 [Candidatus Giovannonibacteria bacterium]
MVNILLNDPIVREAVYWLGASWFFWVPAVLIFIFWESWVRYVRAYAIARRKFIVLEIKIPREVAKSPQAMESIFAGIHGTARRGNLIERYWNGWITAWFSLEIVGDGGEIHFYIWTHDFFKRMIEAQIFAQYPSCEIKVVDDYVKDMPAALPNRDWSIWGSEYVHTKPDAYPIRTYEDFALEDISAKEEERKIDPLSSLFEFLGNLRPGEKIWIQMLVRPAMSDRWKREGEALVAKMAGKAAPPKVGFLTWIVDIVHGALMAAVAPPAKKPMKKEADQFRILNLSPGERATMEAIERNISKIGFETVVRWIYLARPDVYNFLAVPAINGIFRQFNSQSLNGFAGNGKVVTSVDYWFVETRNMLRKIRLYKSYRFRSAFHPPYNGRSRPIVLSSSELATIYHFPGMVVSTAAVPRTEAKKGAPPPNLPI